MQNTFTLDSENIPKVLCEKIVVSTVMYGVELYGMLVNDRPKLNMSKMDCLRNMASV